MASVLIHTADEGVTLTAQAVRRLLERGDGDAALLYLALLRRRMSRSRRMKNPATSGTTLPGGWRAARSSGC